MKKIYMIGNTHFDPVWLWRWDEAMSSIHSTFRSALDRMNEDADFIYSFATPPVFDWIKEIDPDMLEEIRERVKEGRWELCEGWWLQPDLFSASGESYARQSLYGQRYLKENFGRTAETVFNIDSFGHNSQTPQILKKSGIKNYCMCRPESHHLPLKSPYFNWIGNDGSSVRAFRAGEISGIYNKDMLATVEKAKPALAAADCHEMMVYGVTNHGGAPTKKAIADIHALENDKDIKVKFSTVAGYFDECGEPKASFSGEMITGDFGPYTNGNKIKKLNREAEYAVLNAERAAIVARALLGREYPKEKIDSLWRDVMFNQFHDILGGASIKEAYTDAYNGLGRAILGAQETVQFALQSINKKIKTLGKNPENPWNIVVWNLNETDYDGYIEAEIQWLHEFPKYLGGLALEDESGKRYECQIILERSVITGFRSRFLFKARVPSLGYKSFKVIKTDTDVKKIDDKSFERIKTDKYELTINSESGYIERFESDSASLPGPIRLVCLEDAGDTWFFNAKEYGEPVGEFNLDGICVVESGALRRVVKATYRFLDSTAELYYTFYKNESYFDIKYRVNFSEKHKVLKLVIDSGVDVLTVSSPFASEKRFDTAADMPMGEWLVAGGDDYSVSVISNSVFSYTKNGGSIELSLLRSCIHGDLRIGELDPDADYPYMEQGITEGEVRIEISKTAERDIAARAKAFNNPPIVISDANHDGVLSPTDSFAKISAESVLISAIKRAEDSCDVIIRLNEYAGKAQTAKLCVFDKSFEILLDPFEIKTLLFTGESLEEVSILEEM